MDNFSHIYPFWIFTDKMLASYITFLPSFIYSWCFLSFFLSFFKIVCHDVSWRRSGLTRNEKSEIRRTSSKYAPHPTTSLTVLRPFLHFHLFLFYLIFFILFHFILFLAAKVNRFFLVFVSSLNSDFYVSTFKNLFWRTLLFFFLR